MRKYFSTTSVLIRHIVSLLIAFEVCRILFFVFNYSNFSDLSFAEFIWVLFVGLRFDLSIIVLFNSFFILLYLLPFAFREKRGYKLVLKALFVIVNSCILLVNCVDFAYFQFTLKRTNANVFNFFSGKIGNDLARLAPVFFRDYWYVVIIGLLLTFLVSFIYQRIERKSIAVGWNLKQYGAQTLIFALMSGLSVLAYRGGFQLKPISIVSAGEYVQSKYIPLVINTPFSIVKTLDVAAIEPSPNWKLTNESQLRKLYNPWHAGHKGGLRKMNVFVIALESFSKEYIGALNGRSTGYTPFLDSLIGESLTFTNAFANGKTSIEGIPSIVAGLPSWMNEPYITSPYGSNQINSIANLLKPKGYYTAFFHGGTNGTMGFDAFANLAGYSNYFGRTEYRNENDYDGSWGIWDEEFLQYVANTINKKKQPFFSTVFTLTSHHPYAVPDKYKDVFKEGELPIHRSIRYADYALRKFFETAQKMPWFKNTLFVLVADHTGVSSDSYYTNRVGNYRIPIIYYTPRGHLKQLDSTLTQQIDIMPSVLDYINYPSPYFSFGNSVFDARAKRFAMMFNSGIFQLIQDDYVTQFDGDRIDNLNLFKSDSLLTDNIYAKDSAQVKQMDSRTKAIVQTYQQSLLSNKMHY